MSDNTDPKVRILRELRWCALGDDRRVFGSTLEIDRVGTMHGYRYTAAPGLSYYEQRVPLTVYYGRYFVMSTLRGQGDREYRILYANHLGAAQQLIAPPADAFYSHALAERWLERAVHGGVVPDWRLIQAGGDDIDRWANPPRPAVGRSVDL